MGSTWVHFGSSLRLCCLAMALFGRMLARPSEVQLVQAFPVAVWRFTGLRCGGSRAGPVRPITNFSDIPLHLASSLEPPSLSSNELDDGLKALLQAALQSYLPRFPPYMSKQIWRPSAPRPMFSSYSRCRPAPPFQILFNQISNRTPGESSLHAASSFSNNFVFDYYPTRSKAAYPPPRWVFGYVLIDSGQKVLIFSGLGTERIDF